MIPCDTYYRHTFVLLASVGCLNLHLMSCITLLLNSLECFFIPIKPTCHRFRDLTYKHGA